ncbi:hypothetical protein [Winogradskyella sp. PG-2]|uniref:hypothetical protein n=1 Tax=Winogradskyella sp. PG-2 TaxID=754409 RepID=UPI0004586E5A|nr:hypothetical protein [Winogradskyella sp. PG-2]BAO75690.1 hypothetical protein WPG_1460 [Winogradskyella sp. PG-2]
MKKSIYLLICFISILAFQSCSSVKVLDSWKSEEVSDVKSRNFLVVARSENKQARLTFENEIVKQMQSKGYSATASYSKFGDMKPNEKPSESNKGKIKKLLEAEGFDGVVLTVMKDYQEETRLERNGGYYEGGNYYGYYPRYYGGFYTYYRHPMSMTTLGNYVPETITERTSKVYILETTVYDLKAEDDKQLVAIVTSKIDNPESASEAASAYVKKVAASLN